MKQGRHHLLAQLSHSSSLVWPLTEQRLGERGMLGGCLLNDWKQQLKIRVGSCNTHLFKLAQEFTVWTTFCFPLCDWRLHRIVLLLLFYSTFINWVKYAELSASTHQTSAGRRHWKSNTRVFPLYWKVYRKHLSHWALNQTVQSRTNFSSHAKAQPTKSKTRGERYAVDSQQHRRL